MSGIEFPYYIVAYGDLWLTTFTRHGLIAALAFSSRAEAEEHVRNLTRRNGKPQSLYRIVEYRASGDVREGGSKSSDRLN